MKYQYVILDADHTLFDFDRSEKAALLTTLRDFGLPANPSIHRIYQDINKPLWRRLEAGAISATELKYQRTQQLFQHIAQQHQHEGVEKTLAHIDLHDFLEHYLQALAQAVFLLPGVRATLSLLAPRCRMMILTNGIHAMQKKRLQNAGLEKLFSGLIASDQIGAAKPDVRMFSAALELLGHPPKQQVLMVGDQLATDIAGANQMGIPSCWVHPAANRALTHPIQPTYAITRFDKLLHIVQSDADPQTQ